MAKAIGQHDIGAVLLEAFRRSGRSIKSVADESGVGYAAAHGFINGDRDIQLRTASKLAAVLGVEARITGRGR
jgi:plasmid maintenance system antidote protein VapI